MNHRTDIFLRWISVALLLFAFSSRADEFVPFRPDLPVGATCTIDIALLHPTQMAVGFHEVKLRSDKIARWKPKKFEEYLREKIAPIVIGPSNAVYLLDHHHLARVLHDSNLRSTMYAVVKGSFTNLAAADFWPMMISNRWVYLNDENGKPIKDVSELPKSIGELHDDPYRSLAWAVRDAAGYEKSEVLYADFQWADFFRTRIQIAAGDDGFNRALADALRLCHSAEAAQLPGFKSK